MALKGTHLSDSYKQKVSKAMKRYYRIHGGHSKAVEKKIGEGVRKHYRNNPELRKKLANIVNERYLKHPEIQQKINRKIKEWRKKHPEHSKKIATALRSTAVRKKIDRVITAWWKDNPNARKNISKKVKQFFIKNPNAFKEFLKHGKNPLKPHLKTLQGFLVRSLGEKLIANFLRAHCIPCLYESISLMITKPPYKGNICTPDFYIPQWNIFIEFYGGYPQAWKKKVLKNKIYKAHKIPVLAITPAELENLDYYLLREGEKLSESRVARNFNIRKLIK